MLIKEVETSGIREVAEKQGPFFLSTTTTTTTTGC